MAETRAMDEDEASQKRSECRRQAGVFFESTDDIKWLYFDLALRGALEDWRTQNDLERFVREPIWGLLCGRSNELNKQAARYVDRPLFHCTALRDFFIIRLTENLTKLVEDKPIQREESNRLRLAATLGLLSMSVVLWIFVNWWSATLILLPLSLVGIRKLKANDQRILRAFQWHAIKGIIGKVRRGGFDEQTIIEQLEMIDLKKSSPLPQLVSGNVPIPFGKVVPIDVLDIL